VGEVPSALPEGGAAESLCIFEFLPIGEVTVDEDGVGRRPEVLRRLEVTRLEVKGIAQREEDSVLCESVRRGLRSGYFDQGRLMLSRENGLRHFQKLVYRTLAE
jgi:hypothetical protein